MYPQKSGGKTHKYGKNVIENFLQRCNVEKKYSSSWVKKQHIQALHDQIHPEMWGLRL